LDIDAYVVEICRVDNLPTYFLGFIFKISSQSRQCLVLVFLKIQS